MNSNTLIKNPIFLGGHPKAGTTLLLSLFDGHPEVCSLPIETQFFRYVRGHEHKVQILHKLRGIKSATKNPHNPSSQLTLKYAALLKKTNIDELDDESALKELANTWIKIKQKEKNSDLYKYWLEKSPFNELYLPLIEKWFEKRYKFIYIARDPRSNWASYNRRKNFKMPIKDFLYNWKKSYKIAARESKTNPNFLFIQYENLVASPEKTMRTVCKFLGINFSKTLLNPTINGNLWEGNSSYQQNSFSKISDASLNRWKTDLPQDVIETIEQFTGNELKELGYKTNKTLNLFPNLRLHLHVLISSLKYKLSSIRLSS